MNACHPIIAIAALTLRRTHCTRALVWMITIVLAASGGLPFLLKGDGTEAGLYRMALTYIPAMVFIMLLTGTLWLASALIAQETDDATLTTLITSPVRRLYIVAGKWAGLVLINALLLLLAALVLVTALHGVARRDGIGKAAFRTLQHQSLGGRRHYLPDDTGFHQQAARHWQALQAVHGEHALDMPSMENIINRLKYEAYRVAPGETLTWSLQLPDRLAAMPGEADWSLRYRFRSDALTRTPVDGTWTLNAAGESSITLTVAKILDGEHELPLPTPLPLAAETMRIRFHSHPENTTAVFFDLDQPVRLQQYRSSLIVNLFAAYAVLLCFLAALAALGLLLGTLFSFPVAVFLSGALVFGILVTHAFTAIPAATHNHGETETLSRAFAESVGNGLEHLHARLDSTLALMPLGALADGRHIGATTLMRACLWLLVVLPLAAGVVVSLLLAAKEFP